MTITAAQIREARELLGLAPSKFATTTVTTLTVNRAEADDHSPPIAETHMKAIRRTLERLGVEFTADGVRLRSSPPTSTDET